MTAPAAFDPTRVAHLTGRVAPVTEEVDAVDLDVTGELPAELDGVYLRNGPNPRFTPIGPHRGHRVAPGPHHAARGRRTSPPRSPARRHRRARRVAGAPSYP